MHAVAGRTPESRFDVASATPSASFGPCGPLPQASWRIARNAGEQCSLRIMSRRAVSLSTPISRKKSVMRADVFRALSIVASISAIIASMRAIRASSSVTWGTSKYMQDAENARDSSFRYAPQAPAARTTRAARPDGARSRFAEELSRDVGVLKRTECELLDKLSVNFMNSAGWRRSEASVTGTAARRQGDTGGRGSVPTLVSVRAGAVPGERCRREPPPGR